MTWRQIRDKLNAASDEVLDSDANVSCDPLDRDAEDGFRYMGEIHALNPVGDASLTKSIREASIMFGREIDSNAIDRLLDCKCVGSWIPQLVHTVTDGHFRPGLDFSILLKSPDGLSHTLRVTIGITHSDKPRASSKKAPGLRLSVLWDEFKIVDCVQLSLRRSSSFPAFIRSIGSHLVVLGGFMEQNVQAHSPDGRGGALNAELRLELEKGKPDTSAHPVGCRALLNECASAQRFAASGAAGE
jgi:hypothetical protein